MGNREEFYADTEAWDHEFCEPYAECCYPPDGADDDDEDAYEGKHRQEV